LHYEVNTVFSGVLFFSSFKKNCFLNHPKLINRNDLVHRLQDNNPWDIIIIGGGASGLGIAVDAASRGFRTVLFEQYDFAKGTSSKSTKLVHGGVRYLAQGNITLVSEALEERGLLAKNARHLFKKQEFIIPNYTWWGGYYYALGLKLYDFLSGKRSLGKSQRISKKRVIKSLPTLKKEHLYSGVSYFDGQFDDARLALNLAQTAIEQGATVLNYFKVVALIKDENDIVSGVEVEDTETQQQYLINSKVVINATGIFTDKILKMQDPGHKKTVVPSQGVHLVLDRSFLNGEKAIMIPKTSDGRVLFIIPWHDKVIAGTTDTLIKKPKIEPIAEEKEIDFILETINTYLSKKAERKDVLSVFSGLRPLAKPKGDQVKTKEVSRSHKIIISGNLLSIVGGKWTTYRKMAEDVIDKIIAHYSFLNKPSVTRQVSIHGNLPELAPLAKNHLYIYGAELDKFLDFQAEKAAYQRKIHKDYSYTVGQVVWSVHNEYARTVEDFLARRIRLLLLDARAAMEAAELVSSVMAEELDENAAWAAQQTEDFIILAEKYVLK
jgi:glycerol-3-phosphate dehydrogenase